MVAYLFKLDPVMVLDEPDDLRRQVREASAMLVAKARSESMEEVTGG